MELKHIKNSVLNLMIRSLNSDQMIELAREFDSRMDLATLSGFGQTIRIPPRVAAETTLDFFSSEKELLLYVAHLIRANGRSAGGAQVHLRGMEQLIDFLHAGGWKYYEDGYFGKDQSQKATEDWGFLIPAREYHLAFASIDLASSSKLIESEETLRIERAFVNFRHFVQSCVEEEDGRIWKWAGDGGLAVFHGNQGADRAFLAMANVLLLLPAFNIEKTDFKSNALLRVRIALHYGTAIYQDDVRSIYSRDMQTVQEIEKNEGVPDRLVATSQFVSFMRPDLSRGFASKGPGSPQKIYQPPVNV